jgi:Ala-tRNA(Pro) deacylase
MILENGAPQNIADRLPKEQRVYSFLDSLNIDYKRVDHEPAMTMEACEDIDKALGAAMCKNLFLSNRQETAFYLLLIPADKPFKTKDISSQLGVARLSFGKAEFMEQYLDITPGSLSVFGLMNDRECNVQLLIDSDLLSAELIGCHPCVNTSSLAITVSDLMEKIIPALKHSPITVKL